VEDVPAHGRGVGTRYDSMTSFGHLGNLSGYTPSCTPAHQLNVSNWEKVLDL